MSDPAADDGGVARPAALTAGQLLRQAREACGLHIAALAVSLKVPVRKLEALEGDRLDELPDAVFARALAASVCRALRIDSRPILALLPEGGATLVPQRDAGINAPFRGVGDGPPPSVWSPFARPAVVIVLLLLVGIVVLLLWPSARLAGVMKPQVAEAVAPVPVMPPGEPAETVLRSDSITPAAPANAPAPSASASVQTPAAALVVPTAPVTAPAPAAASAASVVTFAASATSWVEVRDARGTTVLQRTLQAGESAGATGALPLVVVVGRADATRVQVRGQDFDLSSRVRDNVARFEVR